MVVVAVLIVVVVVVVVVVMVVIMVVVFLVVWGRCGFLGCCEVGSQVQHLLVERRGRGGMLMGCVSIVFSIVSYEFKIITSH